MELSWLASSELKRRFYFQWFFFRLGLFIVSRHNIHLLFLISHKHSKFNFIGSCVNFSIHLTYSLTLYFTYQFGQQCEFILVSRKKSEWENRTNRRGKESSIFSRILKRKTLSQLSKPKNEKKWKKLKITHALIQLVNVHLMVRIFYRSLIQKPSNCKMSKMHVRKISWQNLVQTNSSHLNS